MDQYSVLVYGGGNCEIAASLQQELEKLGRLENIDVFGRGYIFGNSCLAMYKRFDQLKEQIESVKAGGVYEYLSTNDVKINTMEMQMRQSSHIKEFEDFLNKGLDRVEGKEIILVLVGQSNEKGLFIDFLDSNPTYMPYNQMLCRINTICKRKKRIVHLVLDIPKWHAVKLPYLISRYAYINEVFIYERKQVIDVLPIYKYIEGLEQFKEEKQGQLQGYKINTHPMWWNLCRWKWEAYLAAPGREKWKEFYNIYKNLVRYSGDKYTHYQTIGKNLEDVTTQIKLDEDELREYFDEYCMEELDKGRIETWLQEMKSCIDYYKL